MKTFKDYRESKKKESMTTSFGSHSLSKNRESMTTSFGSHSLPKDKKLDEKVESKKGHPTSPAYDAHAITPKQDDHIHDTVAPLHDDNLSLDGRDAVADYSNDSRPINSMLHQHDKGHDISTRNTQAYRDTVGHLDSVLSGHKTTEDTHLFTGIKYSPAKHFKRVGGKLPEKVEVNLPAFTSTSTSLKAARCFSEPTMHPNDERHGIVYPDSDEVRHIIKIHVPKGSHAVSLKEKSFCPAEKEVLMHRGHDIELHHTPEKLDDSTYLWSARVVGHKLADLSKPVE